MWVIRYSTGVPLMSKHILWTRRTGVPASIASLLASSPEAGIALTSSFALEMVTLNFCWK